MKYFFYQHEPCLNLFETPNKFIITHGRLMASPTATANSMVPAKLQRQIKLHTPHPEIHLYSSYKFPIPQNGIKQVEYRYKLPCPIDKSTLTVPVE